MGRRLDLLSGTALAVIGLSLAMPVASAVDDEPVRLPTTQGARRLDLPTGKARVVAKGDSVNPFPGDPPADPGPEPPKPEPAPLRETEPFNDPATVRAQASGAATPDPSKMSGAIERPGQPTPILTTPAREFVLPADRLPIT